MKRIGNAIQEGSEEEGRFLFLVVVVGWNETTWVAVGFSSSFFLDKYLEEREGFVFPTTRGKTKFSK